MNICRDAKTTTTPNCRNTMVLLVNFLNGLERLPQNVEILFYFISFEFFPISLWPCCYHSIRFFTVRCVSFASTQYVEASHGQFPSLARNRVIFCFISPKNYLLCNFFVSSVHMKWSRTMHISCNDMLQHVITWNYCMFSLLSLICQSL